MLRKPSLSQKKCNTGGGNPWGEMSPPAPPVHPPAGLVAGPAWDPVRSHGRGRAEGVRRDTLGATTAASGVDGPMDLAPSGLPCFGGACPRPRRTGGGRRSFWPQMRPKIFSSQELSRQVADAATAIELKAAGPLGRD